MGMSKSIKNGSRPALFAAVLLSIAAVSFPASAESIQGERSHGIHDGYYPDGYGIVLAHDRYRQRYYAPADRYYDGRAYRRVVPRQHYLHRSKPWRGVRNPSRHLHLHQPFRHGRGIGRRAFRHHEFGSRGKVYRPYYDRRWR